MILAFGGPLAAETLGRITKAIAAFTWQPAPGDHAPDVEGWSSEEVCALLEISEGNQRVLLHRARSKVRSALEDD